MTQNLTACWYPDGRTNALSSGPDIPQLVPCDPSALHSPCCGLTDTCLGTNLCLSIDGYIYRGACTDKTWVDGSCPKYCVASNGTNRGSQTAIQNMKLCTFNKQDPIWTCDFASGCFDSALQFALHIGAPRQVNITGNLVHESSSSANSSSANSCPSTATTTAGALSSNSDATAQTRKVGVAVGVSLGFICFLLVGWIVGGTLKRKRNNKLRKTNIVQESRSQGVVHHVTSRENEQPVSDHVNKSELP